MQQPLPSQSAVGKVPALKEPQLLEGRDGAIWLLWLEQRPHEQGRTTALIRRFGDVEATPTEVTPQPINLRSRVHDYGGGVLAAAEQNNGVLLVWIDGQDGCLWSQNWSLPGADNEAPTPHAPPRRLTQPGEWQLADGVIDLRRHR